MLGVLVTGAAACAADEPRLAATAEALAPRSASSSTSTPASPSTTIAAPASTAVTTKVPPTVEPTVVPTQPPTTLPTPPVAAPAVAATAPAPRAAAARALAEQEYVPFANANGVTVHLPAARVELVGFHQSGHDGAQPISALDGVVRTVVLEDRGRDTDPTGAADIVDDPTVEIRSPVTGRVISANTYRLYCKYSDDLVFIEPDERPGWQVKVFHIDGFQVRPGQRVEAGVTVLARRATVLPFDSQVEDFGARPVWPHVHVEVVDPSVPDRPSPGGEC